MCWEKIWRDVDVEATVEVIGLVVVISVSVGGEVAVVLVVGMAWAFDRTPCADGGTGSCAGVRLPRLGGNGGG